MRRLKILWDEKYPMFSHLSEKQLRERAVLVEKKYRETLTINQIETEEPRDILETSTPGDESNANDVTMDMDANIEITTRMKERFEKHLNNVTDQKLCERQYATRVNCNIGSKYISIINNIGPYA